MTTRRRAPLLAALLLGALLPASAHAEPPAPAADLDFTPEARRIARLVACAEPDGTTPAGVSERTARYHCRRVKALVDRYRAGWLAKARPFFEALVPGDLPDVVVYPFGGADLVHALAVFPDAREITTLSLEHAGDPGALADGTDRKAIAASLRLFRDFVGKLLWVNHNRTIDLARLDDDPLPAPLAFALLGLQIHDRALTGVRYFDVADDGALVYLSRAEVARRSAPLSNVELRFRRAGDPAAPEQVFRHIQANLDDAHLAARPGVLAHLRAKGRVTAMTKAASYLLWREGFSAIRGYLLDHMAWMVSDSSGIAPFHAAPAGFVQTCYGRFSGIAFHGTKRGERAMKKLWASQPRRALPFYFGYPDARDRRHLLVTAPDPTRGSRAALDGDRSAPAPVSEEHP